MNEPAPFLGEVRVFREGVSIPLRKRGYADHDAIPLEALSIFGDRPDLRCDTKLVERVWDGENWVSTDPLDAPAPSTQV